MCWHVFRLTCSCSCHQRFVGKIEYQLSEYLLMSSRPEQRVSESCFVSDFRVLSTPAWQYCSFASHIVTVCSDELCWNDYCNYCILLYGIHSDMLLLSAYTILTCSFSVLKFDVINYSILKLSQVAMNKLLFRPYSCFYVVGFLLLFQVILKLRVTVLRLRKHNVATGWLDGTTGSASDQRSEGCGLEAY